MRNLMEKFIGYVIGDVNSRFPGVQVVEKQLWIKFMDAGGKAIV